MTTTTQALVVDAVSHRYDGTPVLDDVSLEIEPGEFVTLLGPSGCGKTTLLRIIAGFLAPTSGRIVLGGQDLASLPPHRRPLNTVFQRPTLFPHLNVFDNVAFGLRVAKVPKREIRARVEEALELVSLRGMARRRAGEMSGGQMQRVALARALVNKPPVLLLDEPLSALDLKIRLEMESELRRVHAETGASFIYVTHDQREALALSDRIAVLSHGRIEQLAAPDVVYGQPATPFTARFVGDANVLPVVVEPLSSSRVTVHVGTFSFELPYEGDVHGDAWLILRPEAISFTDDPTVAPFEGVVRDVAYRGTGTTFRIAVPGLDEDVKAENAEPLGAHRVGSEVRLTWERESCWLLERSSDHAPDPAAVAVVPASSPAAPLRA